MGDVKMKVKHIYVLFLFLPALLYAGQADTLQIYNRSLPLLNNHFFIPNSNFESPFMTTFFKTGIGGGVSLNSIPIYANNGELLLGTLEGENTYVIADVHVQVEVKDWLSTWFRYQANARIGSSKSTILAHGVTSITGFEFGWMLKLWQDNKNALAGVLSINNSTVSRINLADFIKEIINDPEWSSTSLSESRSLLEGLTGIRYAHSFNDMVGIQAFTYAAYGESIMKYYKNVWKFDSGILGSFNFRRSHGIPVGINLGFSIQKFALFEKQQEDNTNSIFLKLAYTGRDEYSIGLELTYIRTIAPLIKTENTLEYLATSFVMVYYF